MIFAFVGPYGKRELRFLAKLTGRKKAALRNYASLRHLTNEHRRPALDLVVVMPRFETEPIHMVKLVVDTKAILYLEFNFPRQSIDVRDNIARVCLPEEVADIETLVNPYFREASLRHAPDWPWHLVAGGIRPKQKPRYYGSGSRW